MHHTVLIVDDNQEMLLSLKDGLEQYDRRLKVLLAGNGLKALELMQSESVNMVIADLKMPRMDGLTLLERLNEEYPDVPVIIITGYGTPETERMARAGGAEDYLEKPFMVAKLAGKVDQVLKNTADGGILNNISPTMFIQLIEVEQKTCTVRFTKTEGDHSRQGVLFFTNGELMDARLYRARGREAALELLAWDQISLSIQNHCPVTEKRIKDSLQGILMASMQRKDEDQPEGDDPGEGDDADGPQEEALDEPAAVPAETKAADQAAAVREVSPKPMTEKAAPQTAPRWVTRKVAAKPLDPVENLKSFFQKSLGRRSGVRAIYKEAAWGSTLVNLASLGDVFNSGKLYLGYIDNGTDQDFILVPESEPLVVAVDPKCPRDRIMQLIISSRK